MPEKSCEIALHELTSRVEKETAIIAFLDIKGAFDIISYDAIVKAVWSCGVYHTISIMLHKASAILHGPWGYEGWSNQKLSAEEGEGEI